MFPDCRAFHVPSRETLAPRRRPVEHMIREFSYALEPQRKIGGVALRGVGNDFFARRRHLVLERLACKLAVCLEFRDVKIHRR